MSKQFIDTNIFIYAIDADSRFYSPARKTLLNSSNELFTSIKNLSEFLAVVTRIGDKPLSIEDALNAIESFMTICTVLYPTPVSTMLFHQLLRKHQIKGLAVHDLEIASIALANDVSSLVTFNIADFNFIDSIQCTVPPE